MATSGGAAGSTNLPIVQAAPLPVATSTAERPPSTDSKESQRAEKILEQETTQIFGQRQQITPQNIRAMRTRLWNETRLNMQQINHMLTARFTPDIKSNPLLYQNPAEVHAALIEKPQAAAVPLEGPPNPNADAARPADARPGDGSAGGAAFARMMRGAPTAPPPPTGLPTPKAPPLPPSSSPPPVIATAVPPPPPVPSGTTKGTPMGLATTGGTPTEGTTGTPESPTPQLPGDAPVLSATTTGTPQPVPGAPKRPEGMRGESRTLLGSSDPKGVGPSTEMVDAFNTTVAKAQLLFRGGTMQVPVPVIPPKVANDTFVARTREPSKGGEGKEGDGEGKVAWVAAWTVLWLWECEDSFVIRLASFQDEP